MTKLTAKAIRSEGGFIILARERGEVEWVELGVVVNLASARPKAEQRTPPSPLRHR